ncbi:uncharacterized protein LOC141633082 [Silene latifolia]|uniref:uncharacterized protein LOC141633082 n=1 Tax=Silene latifolia TaxID=37657 RepID=UPI003D76D39E
MPVGGFGDHIGDSISQRGQFFHLYGVTPVEFGQFSRDYGALGLPFYTPIRSDMPVGGFGDHIGDSISQRGQFGAGTSGFGGQFGASTSGMAGGSRGGRTRGYGRRRGHAVRVADPGLDTLMREVDEFDEAIHGGGNDDDDGDEES